jgi:hypothetical protein
MPNLERRFTYHPPKGDQPERYKVIRQEAKALAKLFVEKCPNGRERAIALTRLEEAVGWANAAIAREDA